MNTKIRYIVLNASNQPQVPSAHGMALPNVQSKGSPSFLDEATAVSFAKALAKRCKGNNFYVTKVLGGAVSYTDLEQATEGATWIPATADGTDE